MTEENRKKKIQQIRNGNDEKSDDIFVYINGVVIAPANSAYYSTSEAYVPVLVTTRLRFFLHDTLSGANPSAVRIVGPLPFGALLAIDDPVTEGPEITSKVVGNAQGLYLSSSQGAEEVSLVLYADFGFTSGRFKGSSFSVFSRNPLMETRRELAVVGGRGQFRMATGTAYVTSYSMDVTTGDAILEYNVELVHQPSSIGLGFAFCSDSSACSL